MKSVKTSLVALAVLPVLIFSCKKNSTDPPKLKPTISTRVVTNITSTSASSGGFIGDSSTAYKIVGRGVFYSTTSPVDLTTNPTQTYDGLNTTNNWGNYPSNMINLTPNTTYYVRAYVGYEVFSTATWYIILANETFSFKTLP